MSNNSNTKFQKHLKTIQRNMFLNNKKNNNINNNSIPPIKRMFVNLFAVYNLTKVAFFENPGAIFFIIFFPLLLLLIFGSIEYAQTSGGSNPTNGALIIAGISIAAVTGNGLNGLSTRLTQWRQSTIIKRIGSTPLRKWEFLTGALSFYITTMIAQACWVVGIGFAFQGIIGKIQTNDIHPLFIILGMVLTILFAVSLGVFLASLTNDVNTNSLFGIMIFLPSAFLSGQYIPLNFIDKKSGLKIVSEIWPQRYLVIYSYHGWGLDKILVSGSPGNYWITENILLGALYPPLLSIGAIYLSSRLFKWE